MREKRANKLVNETGICHPTEFAYFSTKTNNLKKELIKTYKFLKKTIALFLKVEYNVINNYDNSKLVERQGRKAMGLKFLL